MAKFVDALNTGIANAEKAARNKEEILGIIQGLSEEVSQVTNGAVTITAHNTTKLVTRPLSHKLADMFSSPTELVTYGALFAVKTDESGKSRESEIAEFGMSANGYPVKLTYNNREVSCGDHNSLEAAIQKMLEDPQIGAFFQRLMQ